LGQNTEQLAAKQAPQQNEVGMRMGLLTVSNKIQQPCCQSSPGAIGMTMGDSGCCCEGCNGQLQHALPDVANTHYSCCTQGQLNVLAGHLSMCQIRVYIKLLLLLFSFLFCLVDFYHFFTNLPQHNITPHPTPLD
jgi:hypothetical protein